VVRSWKIREETFAWIPHAVLVLLVLLGIYISSLQIYHSLLLLLIGCCAIVNLLFQLHLTEIVASACKNMTAISIRLKRDDLLWLRVPDAQSLHCSQGNSSGSNRRLQRSIFMMSCMSPGRPKGPRRRTRIRIFWYVLSALRLSPKNPDSTEPIDPRMARGSAASTEGRVHPTWHATLAHRIRDSKGVVQESPKTMPHRRLALVDADDIKGGNGYSDVHPTLHI
jgi:hypothetical protein